jgi:hypothetical protein
MADEIVEIKPGWKTSEFWIGLFSIVMGVLAASGALTTNPTIQMIGAIASGVNSAAYIAGRSLVKR